MTVSEITIEYLKTYLRILEDDTDEDILLEGIMSAAIDYIRSYTGLNDDEIESHEDLTIAYLVLCEDMFDNRAMTVKNSSVNRTVSAILSMHSKNNVG
jgi:uncharacterized phage protein (predicted DNA packaging)